MDKYDIRIFINKDKDKDKDKDESIKITMAYFVTALITSVIANVYNYKIDELMRDESAAIGKKFVIQPSELDSFFRDLPKICYPIMLGALFMGAMIKSNSHLLLCTYLFDQPIKLQYAFFCGILKGKMKIIECENHTCFRIIAYEGKKDAFDYTRLENIVKPVNDDVETYDLSNIEPQHNDLLEFSLEHPDSTFMTHITTIHDSFSSEYLVPQFWFV